MAMTPPDPAPGGVRIPLWPTLLVFAAVAVMIALGVWQLQRKGEKEALIARYAANQAIAAPVAFPVMPPVDARLLFRRSSIVCLEPVRWIQRGGRDAAGQAGYRQIADCRVGAEGPGVLVDLGISEDFTTPKWRGGPVAGVIVPGIEEPGLAERLLRRAPPVRAMLVASNPVAGLRPTASPKPEDLPNNHLAYAGQWFLFAGAALIIYWLALRRRQRGQKAGPGAQ